MTVVVPDFTTVVGYIFTFDLGSEKTLRLASDKTIGNLRTFVSGLYGIGQADTRVYHEHPDAAETILHAYRTEMY